MKFMSLEGTTLTGEVDVAEPTDLHVTRLWHQRLAHVSEKGLNELNKQGLLPGNKLGGLEFCEHSVLGKQHRVRFGKRSSPVQGAS